MSSEARVVVGGRRNDDQSPAPRSTDMPLVVTIQKRICVIDNAGSWAKTKTPLMVDIIAHRGKDAS